MSADPLLLGLAPKPQPPNHPRSAWRAGLLAFLCPGLGHFYVGAWRAAVIWPLVQYVPFILLLGAGLWRAPAHLHQLVWVGVAFWGLLRLAQVADSAVRAKRLSRYALRWFNSGGLYLAFFLGTSVFTSLMLRPWRASVLEPFKIPSSGMEPTLAVGDEFFVIKVGPHATVRRGDIIVFNHRHDGGPEHQWIKRVVGLPGDRIAYGQGVLTVNGEDQQLVPCPTPEVMVDDVNGPIGPFPCFVEGTHRILLRFGAAPRADSASMTVPEHSYFVLGDNRDNSIDSREDGPVSFDDVIGRAAVVWLSVGNKFNIRWDRIGTAL